MTTSSQMLMIHSFSICMELVSESFVWGIQAISEGTALVMS